MRVRYVAVSCQLARPAGYHPPLARSPLFQRKRAFLVHHPQSSFYRIDPRACTTPSLLPCGRRGTACGGGWRTQWLMRVCCLVACAYVAVSYQLARPAGYHPPLARSPLFQGKRAFSVHHPQSSFYRIDPRACTNPSLLPCGRGLLWCVLSFVPFS